MSDTRRTVRAMDANTPPKPGTPERGAAWLDRYGDDYATHDERRVAVGDADSPDVAELWVPTHLSGPAPAGWLEGFRSHFEL